MNRRLHSNLRRIEKSIDELDRPARCSNDAFGQGRTIQQTAKNRELENLVIKLAECQNFVQDDSDQEWLNGVKNTLKTRLEIVLNPPIIQQGANKPPPFSETMKSYIKFLILYAIIPVTPAFYYLSQIIHPFIAWVLVNVIFGSMIYFTQIKK